MRNFISTTKLTRDAIRSRTRSIYAAALRDSRHLDQGNFTTLHAHDLELLFNLYDGSFFDARLRTRLHGTPVAFRASSRMTRSGGKASRREQRGSGGRVARVRYEIAVSATLLLQSFREPQRPVIMSGIECHDRLEALQRVMEHEIVHLVEMLLWDVSSCSAARFQSIARRFFDHTAHRHRLVTPREAAYTQFGIKPGVRVAFHIGGQDYVGFVNRVTKRATVLVEDAKGERYSNGLRYAKFYIPVDELQPLR